MPSRPFESYPSNDPGDSLWDCLACRKRIDNETGISLAEDNRLHVCKGCWGKLTIAQRLEQSRLWLAEERTRLLHEVVTDTLNAIENLCRASCASDALYRFGRPKDDENGTDDFRGRN